MKPLFQRNSRDPLKLRVKKYFRLFLVPVFLGAAGCRTMDPSGLVTTSSSNESIQTAALTIIAFPLYLAGMGRSKGPSILAAGTSEEIQAAAIAAARADLKASQPKVAHTGTIVAWPVGIPDEHLHLVKNLRQLSLPSGCTNPLAGAAHIYAEAYNKEILAYLLNKEKQQSKGPL